MEARTSAGTFWRRFGANLVVLELAVAVVLLVGAGLLGKSFYQAAACGAWVPAGPSGYGAGCAAGDDLRQGSAGGRGGAGRFWRVSRVCRA